MHHENRYACLDWLRGLSALAVCAGHLRAVMFVDYAQAGGAMPLLGKAFYLLTGLGHQAVMVFFVLSGFFVGGSVLQKGDEFKLADYALARLTRLWVVLLPALLLTWAGDSALAVFDPGVLQGDDWDSLNSGPQGGEYSASWRTFFGNLLFLQTVRYPVFGSNGPLWSLANEFWYYVLFPALVIAQGGGGFRLHAAGRLLAGVLVLVVLAALPMPMKFGFLVWLAGVLVFVAYRRYHRPLSRWRHIVVWPALLSFVGALLASKLNVWPLADGVGNDMVMGGGCALLLLGLLPQQWPWAGRAGWRLGQFLAEISYSLYLLHFPLVLLLYALFFKGQQGQFGAYALAVYAVLLAGLVACAGGFWWLFERHTQRVKSWLRNCACRLMRAPPLGGR